MNIARSTVLAAAVLLAISTLLFAETKTAPAKAEAKPAAPQEAKAAPVAEVKISDIPGITTPDKTPNACVDCHKNYPERKMDFRLTNILAQWKTGSDTNIVKKAQATVPGKLAGKHPDVAGRIKTIPDDCLVCHVGTSKTAPPFKKMLHGIHLVGGKDSFFLTGLQGNCTSCHKFDQTTGTFRNGSGKEQQ